MNESPGAVELLSSRLDELEKRVLALEHPSEAKSEAIGQPALRVNSVANVEPLKTDNIFPIIGRAMLGIAGAYILRAVAEAGVLPRLPVSAVAIAYAFAWLAWSSRASGNLARVIYSGTSALILAPLLWENALKFHLLVPSATAGVLAAFLVLAGVLELRNDSGQTLWIAQAVAVLTAASLGFASRHVLPFIATLLLAVFASEVARMRQIAEPLWPLLVLVSDGVISALIFIYTGPADARVTYPELSISELIVPGFILFAMNATAVGVRAIIHGRRVSLLEAMQTTVAFLLATAGVVYLVPGPGLAVLGAFVLMLSVCLYAASLSLLRQRAERRNLRVFSAWAAALLIAGSLWTIPRSGAPIVMGAASIVMAYLATRMERDILELHVAVLLLVAVVLSGLPQYSFDVLAGALPHRPGASVWIVSACAAIVSLLTGSAVKGTWRRMLRLVLSFLAVWAVVTLLVHGVLAGAALFFALDGHHVAFLRTFTICLAALVLAFGGARIGRGELIHLAYSVLALVAVKLVFEDLRLGHMGFIAGSIGLLAISLIAIPRLVRRGARMHELHRKMTPQDPLPSLLR